MKSTGAPSKAGMTLSGSPRDPNSKFGDFEAARLDELFLKVKDSFRIDIASVTGTPLQMNDR